MSSVECCEKCGRSRRVLLLMVVLMSMSRDCQASRFNHSAFMDGVQSVVVNPYNRTILNMFDLTEEQIQSIQNRSNPNTKDEATQSSNHQYLEHVASQRLNEIFKRLHKAISNEPNVNRSAEKAGYPICNGETSIPNWQQANNVTLQFASSVFDHNGDRPSSALLRLYKTHPGQSPSHSQSQESTEQPAATLCPDQAQVGPQIRVTVSIVHQQKKKRKLERKKRTCNTTMFSAGMTGWVEIDVKCALAYWEQQQRQQQQQQQQHQQLLPSVVGMLMIEVHDDEENPLKPGLYFEPPTCDQADPAVPWNAYGSKTFVPYLESRSMPRYPRIDVGFNGSTSLSLNNCLKSIHSIPKSKSYISPESTTPNSLTMDNLLDETSETESQQEKEREREREREQVPLVHQHHRRHHHSHQQHSAESESAAAQTESEVEAEELLAAASNSEPMEPMSNHHQHRVLNHHHTTHHHTSGRHHHKHHHLMAHKQE
ncbi:protein anachronism isoform X1 [Drosophila guanche]|uniref:Blast:Protein anachronism n=1 Tax=Drosophila guanche TaxID=7266 RepID=A0A3B0J4M0_DROGU|nr:protein anachronism isoform X1 [Drosophila guanche]SPP74442.1 blast:Protein anachronism [Drosophila guanche]